MLRRASLLGALCLSGSALLADALVIRRVHVVPMDRERVLARQVVVIEEGRIRAIGSEGSLETPRGAVEIDAEGRYLMPGLVDAHVHLVDTEYFDVYLANGITATVNMNGSREVLEARQQVVNESISGPRIFTTGPLVTGEPVRWSNRVLVTTPEEGVAEVRRQFEAGYDFIKIYSGLTAETYAAILAEAERLGIPAIGHVPSAARAADLLAGQKAIHHLGSLFYYHLWPDLDVGRFPGLATELAEAGIWVCPTIALYDTMRQIHERRALLTARPEMQTVSPGTLAWWSRMDPEPDSHYALFSDLGRDLIRALHLAGVGLLAGTDHPNPYVVPGFALHDELEAYTEAGLSNFEALQTATSNPAAFLGADFGRVQAGLEADLLLVDSNPLENLGTLRRPAGVIIRGRWLAREALEARIERLEPSSRTPE